MLSPHLTPEPRSTGDSLSPIAEEETKRQGLELKAEGRTVPGRTRSKGQGLGGKGPWLGLAPLRLQGKKTPLFNLGLRQRLSVS